MPECFLRQLHPNIRIASGAGSNLYSSAIVPIFVVQGDPERSGGGNPAERRKIGGKDFAPALSTRAAREHAGENNSEGSIQSQSRMASLNILNEASRQLRRLRERTSFYRDRDVVNRKLGIKRQSGNARNPGVALAGEKGVSGVAPRARQARGCEPQGSFLRYPVGRRKIEERSIFRFAAVSAEFITDRPRILCIRGARRE